MRIRTPFAATFLGLTLFSSWFSFSNYNIPFINDKFLHFITFFILTVCFYWILETSRRRAVNITFITISLLLSTTSEILQSLINPARKFDIYDILSNILGSGSALILMQWYHKRMLERKRNNKTSSSRYQPVSTEDGEEGERLDLEAGGGSGDDERGQELNEIEASRIRHDQEGEEGDIGGSGRTA